MATELKITLTPSAVTCGTHGDVAGNHDLANCIAHVVASHADLIGSDQYCSIEIDGTWSSADTTAVTLSGISCDATRYLRIYTTGDARHHGVWSTSHYQLVVANDEGIFMGGTPLNFVRIDGLQVGLSSASANYQAPIYLDNTSAGCDYRISNCILKQCANNSYRLPCFITADSDTTLYFWNNICYGMGTTDHAYSSAIVVAAGTDINIYDSVAIGGKYGLYVEAGTCDAKNVYCGGTITEDFRRAGGTLNKTNCASEDQSADDTGTGETATNCVAAAVAIDTDTFVNVTGGSEDFHLAADGNSPLEDAGVDTSGESAPLNFTTDIDGDTITTYPIGADFRYSAPSTTNVIMNVI